jgi:hypothetical protein
MTRISEIRMDLRELTGEINKISQDDVIRHMN